jgi:hypothetical protein
MCCPERPVVISRSLKNPLEAKASGPRFSSAERARPLASIFLWGPPLRAIGADEFWPRALQPLMFAGAVRLRSYDAVFPEGHKTVVADWLLLR